MKSFHQQRSLGNATDSVLLEIHDMHLLIKGARNSSGGNLLSCASRTFPKRVSPLSPQNWGLLEIV